MSVIDEFQQANATYAANFQKGDLPLPPGRKVIVIVCMDARIDPARALGLEEGDAHVIRNAGGRTSEALRSIIVSQQLLGTNTIAVIHHTDCGMLTFSNNDLQQKLQQEFHADASHIDFQPFSNLEQSVRDDIATIKASPFILPETTIAGFIYNVHTGKISPVDN